MLTGVAATHRRVIFGFQFIDVTKIGGMFTSGGGQYCLGQSTAIQIHSEYCQYMTIWMPLR
jgi:hypothetical protein